jgi:hypothetical protein
VRFQPVEVADLALDPAGYLRRLILGFEEVAPRKSPAANQFDLPNALAGEGRVGAVAVALHHAWRVL